MRRMMIASRKTHHPVTSLHVIKRMDRGRNSHPPLVKAAFKAHLKELDKIRLNGTYID